MTTIRDEKARLRREYRRRLEALEPETRSDEEAQVVEAFLSSPLWRDRRWLLGFLPMAHEFDPEALYRAVLAQGRGLGLVRVEGRRLRFHRVTDMDTEWSLHRFGMREPDSALPGVDPARAAGEGAVLLVPGLVFDRDGYRIGYGGGFYDRLLASLPDSMETASLLYTLQLSEGIPREAHDIAVKSLFRPERVGKKKAARPSEEGSGA